MMTNLCGILTFALFVLTALRAGAETSTPVLVELFTSEGCSSCPPADTFLRTLDTTQPISGVQLIVLGEHVDYWDDQGWRDIYSDHSYTVRQQTYAERLGLKSPYTPQMVVDGTQELVGSDQQRASQAFDKAKTEPKVAIQISSVSLEGGILRAHIESAPTPTKAEVCVVLALNQAESQVLRGENKGHRLQHVSIARYFINAGKVAKGAAFAKDIQIKTKPSSSPYRLIAFVQEPNQGKILGAAVQPVVEKTSRQ